MPYFHSLACQFAKCLYINYNAKSCKNLKRTLRLQTQEYEPQTTVATFNCSRQIGSIIDLVIQYRDQFSLHYQLFHCLSVLLLASSIGSSLLTGKSLSKPRGRKHLTFNFSYLLNNEDMNPITAGLSICVSMLSALTIIGMPIEVYLYGDAMVMRMIGGVFGIMAVNYIFLPQTYELRLYSIFRAISKTGLLRLRFLR